MYIDGHKTAGGSSILVHDSCPQREVELKTDLQAVTVSVSLDKEITFCSVYIPPNFSFTLSTAAAFITSTTSFTLYLSR